MTDPQDLAVVEAEARRLIRYGRSAPDTIVPQYPSWTLRDLVIHVGAVHGRTAAICRTLPRERIPTSDRPSDLEAFEWAEGRLEDMLEGLASADPEAEVWTLVPSPRLAFWGRRMVIETGVHRWDAQDAIGNPDPLLPEVAAHGLDEFADFYLPRLASVPSLELVAADLDRAWRFGEGEPSTTVEGTASDLFLRLMSRPGTPLPAAWERAVDALGSPADT